jgi:hypothetical protein
MVTGLYVLQLLLHCSAEPAGWSSTETNVRHTEVDLGDRNHLEQQLGTRLYMHIAQHQALTVLSYNLIAS